MKLIIKDGQSIFDIALIAYQDASRVYDLISTNPIENINSVLTGITVNYTESRPLQNEIFVSQKSPNKPIIINFTQSIFDVAIQYYGSVENVYSFIKENGLENIKSNPVGTKLKYTINNTYVPIYFRSINKNIATKVIKDTENIIVSNFILRQDGGYLLRQDGGKFIRQ